MQRKSMQCTKNNARYIFIWLVFYLKVIYCELSNAEYTINTTLCFNYTTLKCPIQSELIFNLSIVWVSILMQ